jgi:hypothetical protein
MLPNTRHDALKGRVFAISGLTTCAYAIAQSRPGLISLEEAYDRRCACRVGLHTQRTRQGYPQLVAGKRIDALTQDGPGLVGKALKVRHRRSLIELQNIETERRVPRRSYRKRQTGARPGISTRKTPVRPVRPATTTRRLGVGVRCGQRGAMASHVTII